MGRKSNQELQENELVNETKSATLKCDDSTLLHANEKRTIEKRTQARGKLITLCDAGQNIDDILTSLECYCEIILRTIK
jgi:CTP-dependent riboflavin kinase